MKETLKLALESMKRIDAWLIQRGYTGLMPQEKEVITSIESALAQQEQEPVGYVQTVIEALYENGDPISVDAAELLQRISAQPEQEPVAFPRQAGESTWTVDTAFIWRVKHTIDPDTPNDFTPSEEQIETVLLALEKIPSNLYTTPPQRTWVGLTDEEHITLHDKFVDTDCYGLLIDAVEAKLKEKNT